MEEVQALSSAAGNMFPRPPRRAFFPVISSEADARHHGVIRQRHDRCDAAVTIEDLNAEVSRHIGPSVCIHPNRAGCLAGKRLDVVKCRPATSPTPLLMVCMLDVQWRSARNLKWNVEPESSFRVKLAKDRDWTLSTIKVGVFYA